MLQRKKPTMDNKKNKLRLGRQLGVICIQRNNFLIIIRAHSIAEMWNKRALALPTWSNKV